VKPFLNLVTAEQAYREIGTFEPLGTERVDARTALGRVVASEVRAHDDIPHFDRSNMDGFAVRAADTSAASERSSVVLDVAGQVLMGQAPTVAVEPGTAVRVSTGAMMPPGADAVVIVERTEEVGASRVAIREAAVAGQYTVGVGEDLRTGDLVFSPGRRLKGSDVGVLTGVGLSTVEVHRIPRVGIMATGDEIVEPEDELGPGQVRNVNQYLLASLARQCGADVSDYGVVVDREDVFTGTLTRAVADNDAVFISGGSSKGTRDLTRPTIEALEGARIVLHGIAIAPGKPTILARTPGAAIMGLPGNPAAAAVVFALFGQTLVRVLAGESLERIRTTRPTVRARLAEAVASTPGREDYVRTSLEPADGLPEARPQRGKSVAISTIARADGLLRIPLSSEGIEEGTEVDIILL